MKLNPALAKTLLMAASIGMVVPVLSAQTPPKKEGTKSFGRTGNTPKAKAPTPTPKPEVKPAPEPVIPGMVIARGGGLGFLSLTVDGGRFKLSFYDAKKKAVAVDVARAIARWSPQAKAGDDRTVLNPTSDGQALAGAAYVRPPHTFKVYLTLIGAEESAVESYVVDFRS